MGATVFGYLSQLSNSEAEQESHSRDSGVGVASSAAGVAAGLTIATTLLPLRAARLAVASASSLVAAQQPQQTHSQTPPNSSPEDVGDEVSQTAAAAESAC